MPRRRPDHSCARPEPEGAITQRPPQPHARPSIQQLLRSRSTFASTLGAPGQPSPATSALLVNPRQTSALLVNFRQQLRRSQSTFASNFGAPSEPSQATSALLVNFRQQPRRSQSTFASNFGAPCQPSPATSARPVSLASNFGAPGQPLPATLALLVNPRLQLSAFAVGPFGFSVPLRPSTSSWLARTIIHISCCSK